MNATTNGSTAICSSVINPTPQKIGETIAYCLILIVSLFGNLFIALIVYKTQSMRKPINFFIVNMGMSDLLFAILLIPRDLTELYANFWLISGPVSQALCNLYIFLLWVFVAVSPQSLVLIAVDRFGAVVFPLRSPLISSKRCPFFILATWIVAMSFFTPLLLSGKRVENQGQQICAAKINKVVGEFSSYKKYHLFATFVFFSYIPVVLLSILYSIILIKLKSRKIPGEQSVNADEQRARRNRNILKMAIAIVLGFVLCWVPFSISWVLVVLAPPGRSSVSCGFELYQEIARFMVCVSCAMNPCICFIFSGNYRGGLKKLLKCFG